MFIKVCSASDLSNGEIKKFEIGERSVCLAISNGKFYAFERFCLHKGGPLEQGKLAGEIVTCPWHEWKWNVASGACQTMDFKSLPTYEVSIKSGDIYVQLPGNSDGNIG